MDSAKLQLSKTDNDIYEMHPLIKNAMQELFEVTRPNFYVNNRLLTFSHLEMTPCPLHKYPNLYIRVYHNLNNQFHGYRNVCLCLDCLINKNSCIH
jgi:hypothetical protein